MSDCNTHPGLGAQGEPVAWAYEHLAHDGSWVSRLLDREPDNLSVFRNIRPLYDHPAPAASRPAEQGEPVAGDAREAACLKEWRACSWPNCQETCPHVKVPLYQMGRTAPAASRPAVGRLSRQDWFKCEFVIAELRRAGHDQAADAVEKAALIADAEAFQPAAVGREEIARAAKRIIERIEDADHYFLCDADMEEAVGIAEAEILAILSDRGKEQDSREDGRRALYSKLDGDSLDAICEVIGEGEAFRNYNRGKSAMRDWFLTRLNDALLDPRDDTRAGGDQAQEGGR